MLKLPDGTVKVLVEGSQRARIQSIDDLRSHYVAEATAVPADAGEVTEIEAMRRALIAQFDQYVKLNKKIPPERSEEHTSELQSHSDLVCRLLLEKKKTPKRKTEQDT